MANVRRSAPGGGIPTPDAKVTQTEDEFIKKTSGIQALGSLSLTSTFPGRPGHGTQGKPIVVFANYFEIATMPDLCFYRYSVDVKAEGKAPKPSKVKTKRLITLLLETEDFREALTDFRSMLLSLARLPNVPRDTVIPFRGEGEDNPPATPANYRITIQETGTLLVSQFLDYLKSARTDTSPFPQRYEVLQALNTIIGHFPQLRSDLVTIGQNKHFRVNPADSADLGGGLQALRGFFKSVRPATNRLLLNVNVSHAVCFAPLRLDTLMGQLNLRHNLPRMAKKLKLIRLQRLHLEGRKNKAGQVIPSVVSFWDFATSNDGQSEANPPQIRNYAAGPKDVKFFLAGTASSTSKGLSGKGGKATRSAGGGYISVWDYFSRSKFFPR